MPILFVQNMSIEARSAFPPTAFSFSQPHSGSSFIPRRSLSIEPFMEEHDVRHVSE